MTKLLYLNFPFFLSSPSPLPFLPPPPPLSPLVEKNVPRLEATSSILVLYKVGDQHSMYSCRSTKQSIKASSLHRPLPKFTYTLTQHAHWKADTYMNEGKGVHVHTMYWWHETTNLIVPYRWFHSTLTQCYRVSSPRSLPTHQLRQQCWTEVWSHGSEGLSRLKQEGEWDHATKPHPDHHGDHGRCPETTGECSRKMNSLLCSNQFPQGLFVAIL